MGASNAQGNNQNRDYLIMGLAIGVGSQLILMMINIIICCCVLKRKNHLANKYSTKTEDAGNGICKKKKLFMYLFFTSM